MAENEREYTLEEREYVGEDGKIHHHTNAWMREHAPELEEQRASGGKGASGKGSSGGKSASGSTSRSQGEERGSKSEESEGPEERERGGISKVAVAAAAVGVAAVAAVAVAAARRHREGGESEAVAHDEPREPAAEPATGPRRQDLGGEGVIRAD